jgi:Fe-S-cluster-containing dehydrogenase component
MAKAKYVFRFPPRLIDTPFAGRLVAEFKLNVNILRARVEPDEEGLLVMELTGAQNNVTAALESARSIGIEVHPLCKEITWHPELCVQCTACRTACRTGALRVRVPEMTVTFEKDRCIACELCIAACPYKALNIAFED